MTAENLAIENYACPHCRAVFRTAFQRCPLDGHVLEPLIGDPLAGTSFADRYVIEECVGEGGMGRVYRARHQRMSRRFAIKVLFGDHAADKKMQARLAREAEAASRLSHPNVISVLDFGETDEGLLYLVMDYVQGPTLAQLIDMQAPLDRDRILKLTRDMARGLAHAHKRNLIHRDFKADNVIISTDGEETAKIVDFGIAMLNEPTKSRKLTTEGMVLGTPAVMAPEQAVGEKVDHRTDLFSLGVVIYEMLCGRLPFDGSPLEIARQNLANAVPPISQRVPGLVVDRQLEALSVALMAKRPEDRPSSAKEVLRLLAEMEGENSREFYRSEGQFLEQAGLDPMTPIPAHYGDLGSGAVVRPDPSGPVALPEASHPSMNRAPAAGFTEMVHAQQRTRRRTVAVLVPLLVLVALGGVALAVVLGIGGGTSDGPKDTTAVNATGDGHGDGGDGEIAVAAADAGARGRATDAAVVAVVSIDAAPAVAPDPPEKETERERRRRLKREKREAERKKKEAERKRKKLEAERAALAAKERAALEAARKKKEEEDDVEKVVSVARFNERFQSIGVLVGKAANLSEAEAGVAKAAYKAASKAYKRAQTNAETRKAANASLSRARRAAKRIIKKYEKKDDE